MYEDMPIEHNGELFPPSSPPPVVTSLDVEDVAWLRTGRDVNMSTLETWRLSSMDRDTARVLRERWGAY